MKRKKRVRDLVAAIAWLGASPAQAVVTTYCCDAAAETAYLADLAASGITLSTPHEGFDVSPWGADTVVFPPPGSPAPSVTNLGITWSPRVAGGYLATSTAAGNVHDGTYLMYAVDSGKISHPFPDGYKLDAEGPVLHGVGGWFRASGTPAKLAFIVDGDPARADFTGEQATVSTWKFLGFIDTVAFTGVEIRTADEVGNETRIFFSDAFTFGTTAALPNSAPVATADGYGVDEGGAVSATAPGVLGNDTDADNQPPANAWDGLTAELVAASGPSHATAFTLSSDGSFVYTHDASETTSDSFSYRAFDGTDYSAPVTVTVTVTPVNDAPVGVADSYSLLQGGIFDAPAPGVLGNDSDPDNLPPADAWQGLTASLVPGKGPLHAFDFQLFADGSFTYTHDDGGSTSDSFVYTVADESLGSAEVTASLALAPSSCSGPGDVTISQRAFTKGIRFCDAGTSIVIGPTVWVASPAQLVLSAQVIRFQNDVVVEVGARLSVGLLP